MLKQINFADIKPGQVIKAIEAHSDSALIVFEDGTFVSIKAAMCYDMSLLEDEPMSLDSRQGYRGGYCPDTCIELGIFTREEYEAAETSARQLEAESSRRYKEQQFEQLKRELGYG